MEIYQKKLIRCLLSLMLKQRKIARTSEDIEQGLRYEKDPEQLEKWIKLGQKNQIIQTEFIVLLQETEERYNKMFLQEIYDLLDRAAATRFEGDDLEKMEMAEQIYKQCAFRTDVPLSVQERAKKLRQELVVSVNLP